MNALKANTEVTFIGGSYLAQISSGAATAAAAVPCSAAGAAHAMPTAILSKKTARIPGFILDLLFGLAVVPTSAEDARAAPRRSAVAAPGAGARRKPVVHHRVDRGSGPAVSDSLNPMSSAPAKPASRHLVGRGLTGQSTDTQSVFRDKGGRHASYSATSVVTWMRSRRARSWGCGAAVALSLG